jgi:hypothetical protein
MLVPVPAVPVVIPVPLVPVPVRVGPVAARPPPVVVLVPAVPVGAERPATRLVVAARRPGPVRTGRRGRPGPAVRVRLVAGPVSPVPARPCRLGPCRLGPCRLGPCRLGSGRRGPRGGGRGDRDRFLPRRAALHGHHRAGTTTLRRGTTAAGAPAGRLGRGGPGTAGRPHPTMPRRLDLDDAGAAQVGHGWVEPVGRRPVERLGQQLAGRHHRRQRRRRQRRHPQGDNHRCVAARRHARRSPAA